MVRSKLFTSVIITLSIIVVVLISSKGSLTSLQHLFSQADQRSSIVEKQKEVASSPDPRGYEQAVVSRVVDGDTLDLASGITVRLIGIDSPELHHPQKPVECFGQEAMHRMQTLVEGQVVQLEKDVSSTDKYGRSLRYVWMGETLINLQMVQEGYAFSRSFPPDIKRQQQLKVAERQAQLEKKGLWSGCTVDLKKFRTQPAK